MRVCVCALARVRVYILQRGPWPTLKPSHHSDPLGFFSFYMSEFVCAYIHEQGLDINLLRQYHLIQTFQIRFKINNKVITFIFLNRYRTITNAVNAVNI